jgi:long-subunit acyl-CoA synthetase (AMP-forming)
VAQCPSVERVVCVDGPADGTLTLEDVEDVGDPDFDFDAAWRDVQPRDVLTLIYTSGTTGPPKAVQITHANYMSEVNALDPLLHTRAGRMVSYFPMAHIAERNATHNLPRVVGTTVTCCPDPREVFGYLPEVRPTFFFAVPRIWEKLKAALEAGFASEPDEERRAAVAAALAGATRRVQAEQDGADPGADGEPPPGDADEAILAAIRARIGLDQAATLLVGAAPTPADVLVFFHALGLPINEVWGLSETTAVATISPPGQIRIGSVGQPIPGVDLRLDGDGEVLLRGPIVMPGYRDDPQRTAEAIDADGWFHTGDIGRLDSEGYLWIVDRKKELIINAAGKNMSPANIEARIKSASPLIGQAIAIGDRRAYNVALVVLDPDGASQFARDHGLSASSLAELAGDQAVLAEVSAGIDRANSALSRVEQIKRFAVLPEDWLPGGEQLTPTLKLRRKPIAERYAEQIEDLYSH